MSYIKQDQEDEDKHTFKWIYFVSEIHESRVYCIKCMHTSYHPNYLCTLGLIDGCTKIINKIFHLCGLELNLLNIVPRKHAFSSP